MKTNKQDAFNKSKALVNAIIEKIGKQNKARERFMVNIFTLFMGLGGRYNFTNMSRYGDYSEQTYRNNFDKPFDFIRFNKELIFESCSTHRIIAFDPSYISKSGKKTEHIGTFWSGTSGKALKGLEIGGFAVVDIDNNTAMSLEAVQTPSVKELRQAGKTLVTHYASIVIERKEVLESISKYFVADGYFARQEFVNSLIEQTQLQLISKMRKDANLYYLYQGKPTGKKGRPKMKDGKIDMKNIDKRRLRMCYQDIDTKVYQGIVYSVTLKRKVKLAYVEYWRNYKFTGQYAVLFSTDKELSGELIYRYYKGRFQIEFLFRDAKQFAGLTHSQARSESKLHFHFNTSLTAVSIAKAIYYLPVEKHLRKSFSMSDVKTLHLNKIVADRIFSNLGLDLSCEKIYHVYCNALWLGKIAS
jgi:hypothetical protein